MPLEEIKQKLKQKLKQNRVCQQVGTKMVCKQKKGASGGGAQQQLKQISKSAGAPKVSTKSSPGMAGQSSKKLSKGPGESEPNIPRASQAERRRR